MSKLNIVGENTAVGSGAFESLMLGMCGRCKETRGWEIWIDWIDGFNVLRCLMMNNKEELKNVRFQVYETTTAASRKEIFLEIGGGKAIMTLGQVYSILKSQGHGQKGVLGTGRDDWNVFYVRDNQKKLWEVGCYFSDNRDNDFDFNCWRGWRVGWVLSARRVDLRKKDKGWKPGIQFVVPVQKTGE